MKKVLLLVALVFVGSVGFRAEAAFWNTDVVGSGAVTSFAAMLDALESKPVEDEMNGLWILIAPDGDAAFWFRKEVKDASSHMGHDMDGKQMQALQIWFDAEPFVKAGLDLNKLPSEMKSMLEVGKIMFGRGLSGTPSYEGEVTPAASFEQIVKLDRDLIGYHTALDHYGVTIAPGTLFEWAKDMDKNDKDIVFVLDPQIFIDAGVDPTKVEGWVFDKVPVEDERGRAIEADKFLKPFNLK
ncbi:hypothetical protein AGMMS50276_29050 [Synergistales bacterium]|nr:hypothetical protein AGMMS50276_29050 [Synergistales bacterium]